MIISSPFSELQDRCHLGLRPVSSWPSSVDRVKTFIFPTSRMEEYRVILAKQDNLLTLSELQDRCRLALRPVSSSPFSVDRVKIFIFLTSRMEECRVILAEHDNLLTFLELQDRVHLSLRLCRVILAEQDNLLTFSELQDRFHLVLLLLIGLRHLFSLPRGWKSVEYLSRAGYSPHLFRIARPVSSWHSSVDRVKTFISLTSKMEQCRIILEEQDNLRLFNFAGQISQNKIIFRVPRQNGD
ncbi:hypothetical protein GQ457_07G006720 [Hibiscus cannabinus]